MKRLLPFLFILTISFACSKEEFDISGPNTPDEDKTATVVLNNVPQDFRGDSVYIFTLDNEEEFFSATQATATEDAEVRTAVPAGNAPFTIVAYIPTVADWTINDAFEAGWYSTISGATDRNARYITDEWENASSFENSDQDGANDIISVELSVDGYTSNNEEFDQGDIIEIEADVENNVITPITNVTFSIDGTSIQELTEEPYEINFNTVEVAAGQHVISVTVTNENGDAASDELEIIINTEQNEAPFVNLSGISNGNTYDRQTVFTLNSNVSDPNGIDDIDRVEFTINGSIVATITEAPFTYRWDSYDNQVGNVTIQVTAFDQAGASRSDFANVELVDPENYAPRVTITSPSNGANITAGDLITISTNTSDDENDEIIEVDFYFDGSYIGASFSEPFELVDFNTTGYPAGEYEILARVYDSNFNSSTDIITINITE